MLPAKSTGPAKIEASSFADVLLHVADGEDRRKLESLEFVELPPFPHREDIFFAFAEKAAEGSFHHCADLSQGIPPARRIDNAWRPSVSARVSGM
jgi:hypothetical protein